MKKFKWWRKFKNSYLRLVILTIISLVVGFHLMIFPEKVHSLIIRGVGLTWILEGLGYIPQILIKYIDSKVNNIRK